MFEKLLTLVRPKPEPRWAGDWIAGAEARRKAADEKFDHRIRVLRECASKIAYGGSLQSLIASTERARAELAESGEPAPHLQGELNVCRTLPEFDERLAILGEALAFGSQRVGTLLNRALEDHAAAISGPREKLIATPEVVPPPTPPPAPTTDVIYDARCGMLREIIETAKLKKMPFNEAAREFTKPLDAMRGKISAEEFSARAGALNQVLCHGDAERFLQQTINQKKERGEYLAGVMFTPAKAPNIL